MNEQRHGTTTRYARGCRCDDCRTAAVEYQREYKQAKRAGTWQPKSKRPRKICVGPECERVARYVTPEPLCGGHKQQALRGAELTPLVRKRFVVNGQRECRICGETLPVESFSWQNQSKGYRQSACIECLPLYARSIRYGLSIHEVKRLMDLPCAGCGTRIVGRQAFIDHCHTTGRVRGALCQPCNTILMAHVTPDILRRLADYLEA